MSTPWIIVKRPGGGSITLRADKIVAIVREGNHEGECAVYLDGVTNHIRVREHASDVRDRIDRLLKG